MRKSLIIFATILFLFPFSFLPVEKGNEYPLTTVVCAVDYETDVVTLRTFSGFTYEFEGVEDWFVGDVCACIMNDNGTPNILDDKIVDVKYCGWIEGWIDQSPRNLPGPQIFSKKCLTKCGKGAIIDLSKEKEI